MNMNQEIPEIPEKPTTVLQSKTSKKIVYRKRKLQKNENFDINLNESSEEFYQRLRAVRKNLYKNSIQAFLTYISDSKPQMELYLKKYFTDKQKPIPKSFNIANFMKKFSKSKHKISNLESFESFFLDQSKCKYKLMQKKVKQVQSNTNKIRKQLKKKQQEKQKSTKEEEISSNQASYRKVQNYQKIIPTSSIDQFRASFFRDRPNNQNLFQTLAVDYVQSEDQNSLEQISSKIEICSDLGFDFSGETISKNNNNEIQQAKNNNDTKLVCKTRKILNSPNFNRDEFHKYQSIFGQSQNKSKEEQEQYYQIHYKHVEKKEKNEKSEDPKIEEECESSCFSIISSNVIQQQQKNNQLYKQQQQQQQLEQQQLIIEQQKQEIQDLQQKQQQQKEEEEEEEQQKQEQQDLQQQLNDNVLSVQDLEKKILRVFSYRYLSKENLAYCVNKSRMKDYGIFLTFRHYLKAVISQQLQ